MADESKLTLLTTCTDSGEAGALASRIEAEGITCVIQGEHHHALLGTVFGGFIEVRVLVAEAALDRARALLESWEAAEPAAPAGGHVATVPESGEARCEVHGSPSIGTCARCGGFVCEACVGGSTEDLLCPACEARANEAKAPKHRKRRRAIATMILAWLFVPVVFAILYEIITAAIRLLRRL